MTTSDKTSRRKRSERSEAKRKAANPLPPGKRRIDLANARDVRREMASLYREMRANVVNPSTGCKLAYVLSQVGRLIEVHELEQRVNDLEAQLGKSASAR